jgi:hypothetical protein
MKGKAIVRVRRAATFVAFANGMSATTVLGEPDMSTNTGGTSATTLYFPNDAAAFRN